MEFDYRNRSLRLFRNILLERKHTSDILFMTKEWNPIKAYIKGSKVSVYELQPLVHDSTRVWQAVQEVSEEKNTPKEELYKQVDSFIEEMGHRRYFTVIRWLGLLLCKILKKNYSGIFVNEESIQRVKQVMGSNPVIFAPSHRSYADFILMSYLCFHYNIEIPAIAAGMDFKGMWVMGNVLRDCCAFFMRRTFGDDKLYKATFREYVSQLIVKGESAVEFFIEGTRSRSGKSLAPKFGFLTMALEPYFLGQVPDITIVPINITYDRTLEDHLFAYEMLGMPKPNESTMGLLKAIQFLDEKYGNIYVEFCAPMSVKEYCSYKGDPRVTLSQEFFPRRNSYLTPAITEIISNLGYNIVSLQQQHSVITPFNIISTVIMSWTFMENRVIEFNDLVSCTYCLSLILKIVGALVTFPDTFQEALNVVANTLLVHQRIVTISFADGTVNVVKKPQSMRHLDNSQIKGCRLSDQTLTKAFPSVVLQQYVNPCYKHLIHVTFITAIMQTDKRPSVLKVDLFQKYSFLRNIFCQEFVFHQLWEKKDYEVSLKDSLALGIIKLSENDSLVCYKEPQYIHVLLMGLLQPFLVTYFTTMNVCKMMATTDQILYESILVKTIQKKLEDLYMSGQIYCGYVLSLDTIVNAIRAFTKIGALLQKKQGATVYMVTEELPQKILSTLGDMIAVIQQIIKVPPEDELNPQGKSKL